MRLTLPTPAMLYEEAERCERLAGGLSNPELVASLLRWAREYRHEAREARPAGLTEWQRPGQFA